MDVKQRIRDWLDIKDPPPPEKVDYDVVTTAIGEMLQKFTNAECVQCHKPILAHYGGFYRDSDGRVFCSHGCIDAHKIP